MLKLTLTIKNRTYVNTYVVKRHVINRKSYIVTTLPNIDYLNKFIERIALC